MRYLIIFLLLFSCASNYTKYGDRDKFVTNIESESGKRRAAADHCKQYNRYYVNDPNLIGVPDFHKRYLCIDELVFEGTCETSYGCKYYGLQDGKKIKFEHGIETNGKKIGTYASARINGNSSPAFTTTTSSSSALNAIEHGLNTLSGNNNSGYGTTRLYYDNSSGGMRECSYESLNGRCFAFKPFNRNSYSRDTLFYNPKEKTMQPCIGPVTALGKCTVFGLFRKTPNSTSQLFYDEENNKMTTCSHVGVDGKCYYFDLSPKKEYRGFQSQSKTNPYYFKAPETSSDLIQQGLNMLGGGCTLGRNC